MIWEAGLLIVFSELVLFVWKCHTHEEGHQVQYSMVISNLFFFFLAEFTEQLLSCNLAVSSATNDNQLLHHETQLHSVFISYSQFGCVGEGQSSETFPVLEPHSFRHVHKM